MSGPVCRNGNGDRGGLMNQRAMGEESVISLQDLGDAMGVCVWCVC